MKVCVLTFGWPPNCGGSGFYAYDLVQGLVKNGHSVTVYTNKSPNLSKKNLRIIHVNSRSPHVLFYNHNLKKYEQQIIDAKFDVILHNEIAGVTLSKAFFHSQKNLMAYHHQANQEFTLSLFRKFKLGIVQIMQSRMVKKTDALTFLAKPSFDRAIDKYNLTKPTFILPCVVTLPAQRSANAAKHKVVSIFYPAGASDNFERKGFVEFIPVIKRLLGRGLKFKVVVSGGNKKVIEKLSNLLAKDGINNVEFTPNLTFSKILELYQLADLVVFTSKFEGFGRPFIEALSSGKPLIAHDVGIASEVINNGQNGFIVSDATELEKILAKLIPNQAHLNKMGESARQTDLSRFSETAVIRKFEKMVKAIS